MFAKSLSYIPAIVGLLSIGSFILLSNYKSLKNRLFGACNFLVATWLLFLFIADTSSSEAVALYSLRLALFFGQLMFLAFYYFAVTFPYSSKVNTRNQVLYSLPIIISAILLLTPLGVSSVTIQEFGVQPESISLLYSFSDFIGILYLLVGIGILFKKYRKSNSVERIQIRFVSYGLLVALVVNIFTGIALTFLGIDSQYIYLGGFSLLFFSAMVAYSMVKHKLFDIRLVVVRSLGYVLSLGLMLVMSAFMLFGFSAQLVEWGVSQEVRLWSYVLFTLILALSYPPIKRFFDKLTNQLFYRDAYDTQELMNEFNQVIVSTIDLPELLKRSSAVIAKYLKPDFCDIAVRSSEDDTVRIISDEPVKLHKEALEQIRGYVHKAQQRVLVTDILEEGQDDLKQLLQKADIGMLVRVTGDIAVEGSGYIVLGYKKSGNMYSSQDTAAIEIVANELAIAIQNALQFEEIQKFNVTLQEKIDDATKKLKKTNEKLKAMDETKDEFISMASHQLRTPLTSVKGYLSMVLEGDAGEVSEMQQKLLNQAFISSQRMVYLIADLLNVSRLRTGKFIIEALPTSLADVVEGEVGQLVETAKSRGLELSYEKPAEFTSLMLDETKVRQVVMNFIDNAIYYTPKGGHIVAKVEDKSESIEFTVTDDGMGVPKSEQPHLFSKFYRAGNAKKARPDGTGLGLFMAKKVIVAQGGSILFKSTEGKGSTFGFTFPKAKLAPPEAAATDL
jgi:signal transduction histidine kinase